MTQKIIDAWMQHPTKTFLDEPCFDSLKRWQKIPEIKQELPIEITLAAMDGGKVQQGLLSAWHSPRGPLIPNELVYEFTQKYPDRIFGVAAVDLNQPMKAIAELRKCVNEYGFKALRIVQWLWEKPPTDPLYYPLYAECVNLGIPVCLQVGHTGPLMPSETGRPIPYVDQIALHFPDLKIVCGHIGYPWTQEMIAVATKHENVYIDTSAYTAKRYPPELVQYMKTNGKRKVMFGTNFPMIPHAKCLQDLAALELGEEVEALFLHDNAARVFKLSA